MDKAKKVEPPTQAAFERFVQRIAVVPKAKVDELEAAEKAKRDRPLDGRQTPKQ